MRSREHNTCRARSDERLVDALTHPHCTNILYDVMSAARGWRTYVTFTHLCNCRLHVYRHEHLCAPMRTYAHLCCSGMIWRTYAHRQQSIAWGVPTSEHEISHVILE